MKPLGSENIPFHPIMFQMLCSGSTNCLGLILEKIIVGKQFNSKAHIYMGLRNAQPCA